MEEVVQVKRFLLLFIALLMVSPGLAEDMFVVGEDITLEDVTEFYYTYDSSAFPPDYQRYRFYTEDGRYYFCHEKREGDHWPLTEDDVTVTGILELSAEEWSLFWQYLNGGKVRNPEDNLLDGDDGPWLFLYWKGDRDTYREFSFPTWQVRLAFESWCDELKEREIAIE